MVVVNKQLRNYQDYSVKQLELLAQIDEFGTGIGRGCGTAAIANQSLGLAA